MIKPTIIRVSAVSPGVDVDAEIRAIRARSKRASRAQDEYRERMVAAMIEEATRRGISVEDLINEVLRS